MSFCKSTAAECHIVTHVLRDNENLSSRSNRELFVLSYDIWPQISNKTFLKANNENGYLPPTHRRERIFVFCDVLNINWRNQLVIYDKLWLWSGSTSWILYVVVTLEGPCSIHFRVYMRREGVYTRPRYKLSNDYSAEYRGKGNRQLMVLLVAQ